jgi:membrane-bound serine protease (ClpP class)
MQGAAELEEAKAAQVTFVVLQLDTAGSVVGATRHVIQSILASTVPIAVYVAPNGARAASAGSYIMYSSHIAVMAPGTHLAATTPIQLGSLAALAPGRMLS